MAIACASYQLASTPGHHRLTFEAARLALGASAARPLDFFEACRRKRNVIDYDHASVATRTEAEEIVAEANDFFELVEHWVERRMVAITADLKTKDLALGMGHCAAARLS